MWHSYIFKICCKFWHRIPLSCQKKVLKKTKNMTSKWGFVWSADLLPYTYSDIYSAEKGFTVESVTIKAGCRKCKYFLRIQIKDIFGWYLPQEGGFYEKRYFLSFISARAKWPTHKISDFTEPPFMFFVNNFSNIWHKWSDPNINNKLLEVLHH